MSDTHAGLSVDRGCAETYRVGVASSIPPCRMVAALALATCAWAAACGSSTALHPSRPDGGAAGDSVDGPPDTEADTQACGPRIPAIHRAAEGPPCPQERSPGGVPEMCAVDGGSPPAGNCRQDSDCTAGINGRCLQLRGCYMACSYDQCFQDSDCAGNVPCNCRDSPSSTEANWCLANSNCRVDDDCGPGGYCSPSQLDGCPRMCTVPCGPGTHCYAGTTEVPCWCGQSCGSGYFCHTADDACTNDCECSEAGSACTHLPAGGWDCIPCALLP
jgi:hypothetical protein